MTENWTETNRKVHGDGAIEIELASGDLRASVVLVREMSTVEFSAPIMARAIAEAARLVASTYDFVGDITDEDEDAGIMTTINASGLASGRLVFSESAERIVLVSFFGDFLHDILT